MLRRKLLAPAFCSLLVIATTIAVAAPKVSLEGVKCLMVSKKDANEEKSAKWKKGEVYFCCDGCLGKFNKLDDKGKEKFAAAANHQLVMTKQYEQKGCPFSGGKLNPEFTIKVKGADVGFCCNGCKTKAEKMKEEEQVATLFGEKAFKKAKFEPVKKKDS